MNPVELKIINGPKLYLLFDDETEVSINLKYLREQCPCADCKGENIMLNKALRPPKLLSVDESKFNISDIKLVGNYAARIYWKDGHDTGVYTWKYLQALADGESDNKEFDYEPLI